MTVTPVKTPSFMRRATALTIAALAVVVEISVLSLGAGMLIRPVNGTGYGIESIFAFLPAFLVVGAMIAIPLCLAIGLPLWYFASRSGRQGPRDAVRFGLAAGAGIGGFYVVILGEGQPLASALPLFLMFCAAGISAGWIAHRIGYR